MLKTIQKHIYQAPTPLAGLALGIASLGLLWETVAPMHTYIQIMSASVASLLLMILIIKFVLHPTVIFKELAHPTVGSIVPTFSMATMIISKSIALIFSPTIGQYLWLFAVILHSSFLLIFCYHRVIDFKLEHMLPSWFVPPVGIIVAAVSFPGESMRYLTDCVLTFGMLAYAVMLPVMMHRLIFCERIHKNAEPTIAIMAAPASLSLAGYLTVVQHPSPLIVAILLGIAILMTVVIYVAFFRLLQRDFCPGYAAFTFPMVISATALFKTVNLMIQMNMDSVYYQTSTIFAGQRQLRLPVL